MSPNLNLSICTAKHTVLGSLWAASTEKRLIAFDFGLESDEFLSNFPPSTIITHLLFSDAEHKGTPAVAALTQILEYLDGTRQTFKLSIDWQQFNQFKSEVYRAVIAIPYGQTRTYGQVAAQIGRPLAYRAVGAANATNPLPIIIPCHRLVGKDGALRGYGGKGGIQTKQWLLDFERRNAGSHAARHD